MRADGVLRLQIVQRFDIIKFLKERFCLDHLTLQSVVLRVGKTNSFSTVCKQSCVLLTGEQCGENVISCILK